MICRTIGACRPWPLCAASESVLLLIKGLVGCRYLLPERGDFRTLFEALQLQDCGLTTPAEMDEFKPPSFTAPADAIYVDAASGSDSAVGTAAAPLKSIQAAVAKAQGSKATVVLKAGTYYTDTVQIGKEHSGLTVQNAPGEAVTVSGGVPLSVAASDWKPDPLMKGRMVADLKGKGIDEITGLRLDGQRSIRAKYPNGNMELSGNWLSGAGAAMGGGDYFKGWIPLANHTQWVPPFRHPDAEDVIANDTDWPSVDWPHYEGSQTGEGDKGDYHIGVGGYCEDDLQDPLTGPTGYWCAMAPPRGQCWDKSSNKGRGCTQTHMSPDGVVWPRANDYKDPTTAVILSWRGGGRWFSQMWKMSHFVKENSTLIFDPTTGGQGGEGMTNSGQWWIENGEWHQLPCANCRPSFALWLRSLLTRRAVALHKTKQFWRNVTALTSSSLMRKKRSSTIFSITPNPLGRKNGLRQRPVSCST